jgi:prevent-host-death family protein
MKITATEFKARCLKLIDQVRERGEPIVITKRGRVVATLEAAGDFDEQPWRRLRGTARWRGDPTAPAISEKEIQALK